MSVKIDLPPEVEANLAAQAASLGVSFDEHLRHVLVEWARAPRSKPMTPRERATFWRDSVKGLPATKPLSDRAISRESIYAERG
jgi:hypothetical protein